MARGINDRLKGLENRRQGTDLRSYERLNADAKIEILAKSLMAESWQKRAASQPYTRYALGAMQEVGADYTRISIETAERVGKQLVAKLPTPVDFRLQGSVPLNIHIKGVSDVDLLALDTTFLTYATVGTRSLAGLYHSPSARSSISVLLALRLQCERVLKDAYPAAKVDCTGGKCVALSGGSLARPVDVVPSHWWDTVEFQASGLERDRGVTILDKMAMRDLDNLPFLHIARVNARDGTVYGGLKKAIRLVKNVKSDAENEASAAKLPSFDIAALLYHADQTALCAGYVYELAILREAQRFLDWCYHNQSAAKLLRTPDGSRAVLDTDAKIDGLLTISCELDKLAKEVAREQLNVVLRDPSSVEIDEALRKALIPAAA